VHLSTKLKGDKNYDYASNYHTLLDVPNLPILRKRVMPLMHHLLHKFNEKEKIVIRRQYVLCCVQVQKWHLNKVFFSKFRLNNFRVFNRYIKMDGQRNHVQHLPTSESLCWKASMHFSWKSGMISFPCNWINCLILPLPYKGASSSHSDIFYVSCSNIQGSKYLSINI
jgi:hypothetical protein